MHSEATKEDCTSKYLEQLLPNWPIIPKSSTYFSNAQHNKVLIIPKIMPAYLAQAYILHVIVIQGIPILLRPYDQGSLSHVDVHSKVMTCVYCTTTNQ